MQKLGNIKRLLKRFLARCIESILKSQAETLSPDMTDLMKDVINNTPRPQYIKEVATMFIDEVISNGDFVAIHWRYDKDDWLAANCKASNSTMIHIL